ncbi:Peptidase A1 domain-containing protein [Mycena indigotica]|uniref:Peptidase A1 domain-containing protein n=1 Tax=Mycena indigotica TaxID=2126181 RepID=A0A8H6WHI4_9AGAR|nr:Peptidase A1 domain-containing protein [Mycena indigotica]KAF7312504.1 Peptidase A1 domain-containing protein [Mycena indigotica]
MPRHPIFHRQNLAQGPIPTVTALLDMFEQAHFSQLKILKFWYQIKSPEDLRLEELLLSRIPELFPELREVELCRMWDHDADSLSTATWDPLPRVRQLTSQLKQLRTFIFDPDLPERSGRFPVPVSRFPFPRPTKEFRTVVGKLHAMALAIVTEATWVKKIAMLP